MCRRRHRLPLPIHSHPFPCHALQCMRTAVPALLYTRLLHLLLPALTIFPFLTPLILSSAAPHPVLADIISHCMQPQDRQPPPPVIPPAAMAGTLPFLRAPSVVPIPWPVAPIMPSTYPSFAPIHGRSPIRPFPHTPAPLAVLPPPPPLAPPAHPVPPLPGSDAALSPAAGLFTPTRALISEITNLVPEFCRVALDPARAASGSIATLPYAHIIPFYRSAAVSIDHWLDQMEFRLKSLKILPALGPRSLGPCSAGSVGGEEQVSQGW